jgi:Tfp pilus assembly ATPase PilU
VGRALIQTRDAIVDGEIKEDQSMEFALETATRDREEASR